MKSVRAVRSHHVKEQDVQKLCQPTLQPSSHYMYQQINIQQFFVLPTQCVCVFCVDLRTNSDYFPIQY